MESAWFCSCDWPLEIPRKWPIRFPTWTGSGRLCLWQCNVLFAIWLCLSAFDNLITAQSQKVGVFKQSMAFQPPRPFGAPLQRRGIDSHNCSFCKWALLVCRSHAWSILTGDSPVPRVFIMTPPLFCKKDSLLLKTLQKTATTLG